MTDFVCLKTRQLRCSRPVRGGTRKSQRSSLIRAWTSTLKASSLDARVQIALKLVGDTDNDRSTPLDLARQYGHMEVAGLLVERGAVANTQGTSHLKCTSYHLYCKR